MYCVSQGEVNLIEPATGRVIMQKTAPFVCGADSYFTGTQEKCDIVAATSLRLFALSRKDVHRLSEHFPELAESSTA